MAKEIKTPTLDRLLAEGALWIDGPDYVGIAADGIEIAVGTVGPGGKKHEAFEGRTEAYLVDHPTPDTW